MDASWSQLSVDALLIGPFEDGQDLQWLKEWMDFCGQRKGAVVVVPTSGKEPDKAVLAAVKFHLLRLTHPQVVR
jgi:hypothetical protein